MDLAYPAYRLLCTGLLFAGLPGFWLYSSLSGKHRRGLRQRLGAYGTSGAVRPSRSPRVWLHAASVGEVNAATAIAEALGRIRPDAGLVLSTTTEHGLDEARERLGNNAVSVLAPLDWSGSVKRALNWMRPDAMVCVETEIWPTWLISAQRRNVPTALVNGRISCRSIRRYQHIQGLMAAVLKNMTALSVIDVEDAQRLVRLGAPEARIVVNGNAKFDLARDSPDPKTAALLGRCLHLDGSVPVIVAGSIRRGEARPVIEAYCRVRRIFDNAVLVIAPRHLQWVGALMEEARRQGLDCQRRTVLADSAATRSAPVIVLDTIGELKALYGLADVVFCGGSLVPRGGQNLLEATAWGKPVICGPHMDDFRAATDALVAAGAVFQVGDSDQLAETVLHLLGSPDFARAAGRSGQEVVAANRGAAARHAAVIDGLLPAGPLAP